MKKSHTVSIYSQAINWFSPLPDSFIDTLDHCFVNDLDDPCCIHLHLHEEETCFFDILGLDFYQQRAAENDFGTDESSCFVVAAASCAVVVLAALATSRLYGQESCTCRDQC